MTDGLSECPGTSQNNDLTTYMKPGVMGLLSVMGCGGGGFEATLSVCWVVVSSVRYDGLSGFWPALGARLQSPNGPISSRLLWDCVKLRLLTLLYQAQ
ncbi:hypothetical protein NHX12_011166 [Muraenolepis orangiensis]|uniref:Uncharacterized protein n=1 Tax=Muraenolepis orangiensis TaxID=630683 RepID=A0A9Q0DEQ2_9TELE|nr:hypothetical protein NHX12_011166 [Muraenolepis orangiensis]